MRHFLPPVPLRVFVAIAAALLIAGCAHLPVKPSPAPAGGESSATVKEILAALATSDQAISTFSAAGSFRLESPEFAAEKYFKDGLIAFRRPADLSVVARKMFGTTVMRLTCVGDEFLMEFPATHDKPYYRLADGRTRDVPFSVSPSLISREMFFPEMWAELAPSEVRVATADKQQGTTMLEIGPRQAVRRRVTVSGPPWRIVREERLDERGQVVAISTRDDYRETNGVLVPYRIDAQFPAERTRMSFEMREIHVNETVDLTLFDLRARAREAGIGEGNGL